MSDFNNSGYDNSNHSENERILPPNAYSPKPEEPKKKSGGFGKTLAKVLCIALVFGLVAGGAFFGVNKIGGTFVKETKDPADYKISQTTDSKSGEIATTTLAKSKVTTYDVADLVENTLPSVVKVTNVSVTQYRGFFGQVFEQTVPSAGTGFLIGEDEEKVYIATNNHVVANSTEITVTFYNEEAVTGELQGAYQDKDLAVISVNKKDIPEETLKGVKIATIGNSDSTRVGSGAVVIGNALGYGISVTSGIISGLDREVSVQDNTGYTVTNKLMQTDAAVNPGNSGGPLLNMDGEVIGIVSVKYNADNVGYAIPINQAIEIIGSLMETGSYTPAPEPVDVGNGGFLGIYGGLDIDEATALQYGMPRGVYVSSVIEGSAAESAGIKKGDIVTGIDGKTIETMEQLQTEIKAHYPGDLIQITFAIAANNYMEVTAQVTLGERPAEPAE